MITPTDEQLDIIETACLLKDSDILKITAFAGAAKTPNATMESMSRDSIDKLIEHHYSNKFKSKI